MNILQVSPKEVGGGAERIAWNLFRAYQKRGHVSWLVVGRKQTSHPQVVEIPRASSSTLTTRQNLVWKLHGRMQPLEGRIHVVRLFRRWLRILALGRPELARELGLEEFYYPGSRQLLNLVPERPDIVHCHNLHGGYFDLRYLSKLSKQVPVLLTLHDEWMFTGHCAHSLACTRWEHGCGHCPDLTIYPSVRRDATKRNINRKRKIYRKSRLHIATPSKWLFDRVSRSALNPIEGRVIHNGVDLTIFHPASRSSMRDELNLPREARILLFAATNAVRNPFKNYYAIEQALYQIGSKKKNNQDLIFLALGSRETKETKVGHVSVMHVPYQSDPRVVAKYYQSSDIYVHASRADTFPNTVLESLACGTPVVATAVGGIPEQIKDGVTGFLVPPGDSTAMAGRILQLLDNDDLISQMGIQAVKASKLRYDLNQQVENYLNWYHIILKRSHQ